MNQSIIRERISTNYDTSFQETEYIRTLADGYCWGSIAQYGIVVYL